MRENKEIKETEVCKQCLGTRFFLKPGYITQLPCERCEATGYNQYRLWEIKAERAVDAAYEINR